MHKLDKLGWTQEEIAEVVGLKRNTISEKIIDFRKITKIDTFLKQGKSVDETGKSRANKYF